MKKFDWNSIRLMIEETKRAKMRRRNLKKKFDWDAIWLMSNFGKVRYITHLTKKYGWNGWKF